MYDTAVYRLNSDSSAARNDCAPATPARSKVKRLLDIVVSLCLLLVLLPIFAFIAVCILTESKGPVLFRQRRGGLLGQPFTVYKFRTMRVLEDGDSITQARKNDPRVTEVGAFLRKTSVDELPQLFNVLKGEMSLVGPRPHAVAHDREFQERIPSYARRFAMKPGITGLAQVRGLRGETRSPESLEARLAADLEYIDRWTLLTDVKLLLATLKVPLGDQAY